MGMDEMLKTMGKDQSEWFSSFSSPSYVINSRHKGIWTCLYRGYVRALDSDLWTPSQYFWRYGMQLILEAIWAYKPFLSSAVLCSLRVPWCPKWHLGVKQEKYGLYKILKGGTIARSFGTGGEADWRTPSLKIFPLKNPPIQNRPKILAPKALLLSWRVIN